MLSISKPQTNLIYLSILVGRLDLTLFSILCGSESLLAAICLLIRLQLIYIHRSCQPNAPLAFVLFITRIQMTSRISAMAQRAYHGCRR